MSRIITGIFGGRSKSEKILQRYQPVGFDAPGASGRYDRTRNVYSLTRSPQTERALTRLTDLSTQRASAIRALRPQVRPGFGRLSAIRKEGLRTRLNSLRAEKQRTVGNIREELSRRRIAGSSFQQSQVASAEAEFAMRADEIRAQGQEREAEAFLQELDFTNRLIGQEFDASLEGMTAVLNQLNLESSLTASLATGTSQLLADNLKAQAEARAAAEAAGEDFLGTIIGAFASGGGAGALPVP